LDQASVLQHTLQWEIGRVLLLVYEWLTSTAPALVEALLLAHTHGVSVLNSTFPDFAALTNHIVRYIDHVQEQQSVAQLPKKKKKRKKEVVKQLADIDIDMDLGSPADTPPVPTVVLPLGIVSPPSMLDQVPADLYGLCTIPDSTKRVKMP
ncbi:hypothetical protein C8R46DRAFT_872798, partial [Mycena filopes]